MSVQITVRLSDEDVRELDRTISSGRFPNRASAIRQGLERLLSEERGREIEEADRRGYGDHPQEEWVAEIGLAALSAFVSAEEESQEPL